MLALNGGVSVGYAIVLRILKAIAPFALIFFISLYVLKLKTKNAELKQQLEYTEAHLIKQNESIEKLELESQKYKILQPKEKDNINIIVAAEKVSKLFIDAGVSLFGKEQIQVVETKENNNYKQMNMQELIALANANGE